MGANQNARKLLSTDLVNTKMKYISLIMTVLLHLHISSYFDSFLIALIAVISGFNT